ncbi:hypothetical protein EDC96DRAFT_520952 [Choanephora cucurbitarum]|nr:hypothetical protein EDC96DRAFT_520952 [Choanephora cucurbitarum]
MQANLSQLQYQQLQIQQQQQRLASMMQQKQRHQAFIPPSRPKPKPPLIRQPSSQRARLTTPKPIIESKPIPVETPVQKRNLKQYQERDEAYQQVLNLQHKQHIELAQSKKKEIELASMERRARMQHGPTVIFGPGYRGEGRLVHPYRIRYPHEKRSFRMSKREPSFRFPLDVLVEQAKKEETLVPIRIELEHEGYKLRDTFTWNLHESLVSPEQFADVMCDDLKLPANIFSDQIARAIREQIEDYNLNASSLLQEVHEGEARQQELRTVIKLDVTVGNWELIDQFEWDISCPKNSPEEFAANLVKDLGLGGEFKTAIAHSIREQIHVHIKSLLLAGYEFNSEATMDDEMRHSFLPLLQNIVRDHQSVEQFTPSVIELSDAAVEKMEKDRMREARRKRRGNRARRGVVLPDREPQKTHRTGLAVAPEQDATDEQEQNSHKRSAALKARMNIAAEAATTVDDLLMEQPVQPIRSGLTQFQAPTRINSMPLKQTPWQYQY